MESPGTILRRHGLHAKKAWGQNFLADAFMQESIAELVDPQPGETIVELGAGLGHLTSHLVGHGARVVAVERDRDLAPILRDELGSKHPELEVVEADAARFDLSAVAREAGGPIKVCGNLPYHLGSPILFHVLDHRHSVSRLVTMLQLEVVERIVAKPDTSEYGILSVLLQQHAQVRLALKVPRGAFVPPPAVESAVLVADLRAEPLEPVHDEQAFRRVVKAAFQQRRKTLSNALRGIAPKEALQAAFAAASIDPMRRGETLTIAEFAAFERALPQRAEARGDAATGE